MRFLWTDYLSARHDFWPRPLSVGTHPTVTTCKANTGMTLRFLRFHRTRRQVRRWSVGHDAPGQNRVVASPPRRVPRRVGVLTIASAPKKDQHHERGNRGAGRGLGVLGRKIRRISRGASRRGHRGRLPRLSQRCRRARQASRTPRIRDRARPVKKAPARKKAPPKRGRCTGFAERGLSAAGQFGTQRIVPTKAPTSALNANGAALTLALGCASGPVACVRLGGRQRRGNRADGEYPLACCRIWPDLKMVRSLWRRDPGVATESGPALAEVDWPIWNRGGERLRASI